MKCKHSKIKNWWDKQTISQKYTWWDRDSLNAVSRSWVNLLFFFSIKNNNSKKTINFIDCFFFFYAIELRWDARSVRVLASRSSRVNAPAFDCASSLVVATTRCNAASRSLVSVAIRFVERASSSLSDVLCDCAVNSSARVDASDERSVSDSLVSVAIRVDCGAAFDAASLRCCVIVPSRALSDVMSLVALVSCVDSSASFAALLDLSAVSCAILAFNDCSTALDAADFDLSASRSPSAATSCAWIESRSTPIDVSRSLSESRSFVAVCNLAWIASRSVDKLFNCKTFRELCCKNDYYIFTFEEWSTFVESINFWSRLH